MPIVFPCSSSIHISGSTRLPVGLSFLRIARYGLFGDPGFAGGLVSCLVKFFRGLGDCLLLGGKDSDFGAIVSRVSLTLLVRFNVTGKIPLLVASLLSFSGVVSGRERTFDADFLVERSLFRAAKKGLSSTFVGVALWKKLDEDAPPASYPNRVPCFGCGE